MIVRDLITLRRLLTYDTFAIGIIFLEYFKLIQNNRMYVTDTHKKLTELLMMMIHPNPDIRYTIVQSLKHFQYIFKDNKYFKTEEITLLKDVFDTNRDKIREKIVISDKTMRKMEHTVERR